MKPVGSRVERRCLGVSRNHSPARGSGNFGRLGIGFGLRRALSTFATAYTRPQCPKPTPISRFRSPPQPSGSRNVRSRHSKPDAPPRLHKTAGHRSSKPTTTPPGSGFEPRPLPTASEMPRPTRGGPGGLDPTTHPPAPAGQFSPSNAAGSSGAPESRNPERRRLTHRTRRMTPHRHPVAKAQPRQVARVRRAARVARRLTSRVGINLRFAAGWLRRCAPWPPIRRYEAEARVRLATLAADFTRHFGASAPTTQATHAIDARSAESGGAAKLGPGDPERSGGAPGPERGAAFLRRSEAGEQKSGPSRAGAERPIKSNAANATSASLCVLVATRASLCVRVATPTPPSARVATPALRPACPARPTACPARLASPPRRLRPAPSPRRFPAFGPPYPGAMTDEVSRRRINEAISSVRRLMSSRRLDALHMERSGVPLSLVAIGVLHRIIDFGPIRPTELAERADIQPAALSRQIRILEEGGYTVRVTAPEDGRVALLEATARGREAYRLFVAANDEMLARQLAGWTAAELNDLADRMQRLVADLRGPLDEE
ncbi:hypothetical protein B4N89_09580 [Embleya scabrispora]|uniref:HTH marR-type domain-containing protein n=2 Tax=Embleya scabrispora TaxID=159449 RepID=A0A1T3NWD2_9ACTN|nr:hypothetical protein B4N89_09580 [Embleya scabrispora]